MSEEVVEEKTEEAVVEETPVAEEKVEEPKEEKKAEKKEPARSASSTADAGGEKKEVSAKFKEIVEKIENLSVLELSELVHELEDRFGVSAAAPVAMAGAVAGAPAEEVEEKTSFDVIITSAGDKKIQVIKVVREIKPELGLKEAKDLVEAAPKELAKGLKKEEAEAAKAKLEAAGAGVELK